MEYDFKTYSSEDLPYNTMIFFRVMEALNANDSNIDEFVRTVENWINIYGKIFNKSGKESIEDMFSVIFMGIYFKFREFSDIYRFITKLPFLSDELLDRLKIFYSITNASFKTKESGNRFDSEAFEFYFLNSLGKSKRKSVHFGTDLLDKVIPVLNGEEESSTLPKPFDSLSSFYLGLFNKKDFPENIEDEIMDFLLSTLDNFWCCLKESKHDFSY